MKTVTLRVSWARARAVSAVVVVVVYRLRHISASEGEDAAAISRAIRLHDELSDAITSARWRGNAFSIWE